MIQASICEQKLLGPTVFVPKALIKYVTKNAAALLQQLHYSLQNSKFTQYGERWVCRSLETWADILGCAPRTIQRAFESLESLGLVISDRLHTHRYNQIKSYRVNYEVLQTFLENEPNASPVPSQTVHVEVDNLATSINKNLNKEFKRQQTEKVEKMGSSSDVSNPSLHPVLRINKEGILIDPQNDCKGTQEDSLDSDESSLAQEELEPQIEAEIVETIGHKMSAGLKKLVMGVSLEVIENALTIVRTTNNVKNKAGLFCSAIQKRWIPSAAAFEKKKNILDPDFNQWWELAKSLGLVFASEKRDDQLWIYPNAHSHPLPYEEIRSMFSLSWLQKQVSQRSL